MIQDFFKEVLLIHTPKAEIIRTQPVGGGCINNAAKLVTTNQSYFIKWNSISEKEMFEKEKEGLSFLSEQKEIQIPEVLGDGQLDNKTYLLLEWIEGGLSSADFWNDFGRSLAKLHKYHSNTFGLSYDNYIGRLKQSNKQHQDWASFFIQERLEPQIRLASNKNLIDPNLHISFERLFQRLEDIVPNEKPALIHGDLWSGNFLTSEESKPVLIDPAVHFGHRETELSFTQLFGGFDTKFYQSYNEEYPLENGFEERIDIHNLYPLLVHVNLFGNSYLSGINQTLKRF